MTSNESRLVRLQASGPLMIQGPVRIELPDGTAVDSDRFMVAICTCRRSKIYPLCDTSHRRKVKGAAEAKTDRHPSAS